MFDLLHAYGLGILLAHASGQPVEVQDPADLCPLVSDFLAPLWIAACCLIWRLRSQDLETTRRHSLDSLRDLRSSA